MNKKFALLLIVIVLLAIVSPTMASGCRVTGGLLYTPTYILRGGLHLESCGQTNVDVVVSTATNSYSTQILANEGDNVFDIPTVGWNLQPGMLVTLSSSLFPDFRYTIPEDTHTPVGMIFHYYASSCSLNIQGVIDPWVYVYVNGDQYPGSPYHMTDHDWLISDIKLPNGSVTVEAVAQDNDHREVGRISQTFNVNCEETPELGVFHMQGSCFVNQAGEKVAKFYLWTVGGDFVKYDDVLFDPENVQVRRTGSTYFAIFGELARITMSATAYFADGTTDQDSTTVSTSLCVEDGNGSTRETGTQQHTFFCVFDNLWNLPKGANYSLWGNNNVNVKEEDGRSFVEIFGVNMQGGWQVGIPIDIPTGPSPAQFVITGIDVGPDGFWSSFNCSAVVPDSSGSGSDCPVCEDLAPFCEQLDEHRAMAYPMFDAGVGHVVWTVVSKDRFPGARKISNANGTFYIDLRIEAEDLSLATANLSDVVYYGTACTRCVTQWGFVYDAGYKFLYGYGSTEETTSDLMQTVLGVDAETAMRYAHNVALRWTASRETKPYDFFGFGPLS